MNCPNGYLKRWDNKSLFITLLALWFLLNLAQSLLTEIISDEAYYYLYGKHLAWGYFDHPPAVALLVKISSLFFDGNLGVRFMTVLLQLATLIIVWKTADIEKPEKSHIISFFLVAASVSIFAAYGFITVPDSPLLFFASLFLFGYKKFLVREEWSSVLILSISMSGLVYSKYQAVLVIGFVILSNPAILKSWKFWISGVCALILLSPHIHWQIANDFPSFRYQLLDRSGSFRWSYFLEYLPYQIAVFNPFVLGAVTYVLVKYRPADLFERSLWFLVTGFIFFFWITSFRGHVEPHWTAACSIPIIILLINRMSNDAGLSRFIKRFIAPSFLIIILVRISLLTDIHYIDKTGLNGKRERIEFIGSVSEGLPVAFISSFQPPAMYIFFTGKEAFPVSTLNSRQTQFDIWQFEEKYLNKPVFVAYSKSPLSEYYEKEGFSFYGYRADSLQTTNRLKIVFEQPPEQVISGERLSIRFSIYNPCSYDIDFNHPVFPVEICAAYKKGKETHIVPGRLSESISIIRKGETIGRIIETEVPDMPGGVYHLGITLQTLLGPTLNSPFEKIKVNYDD